MSGLDTSHQPPSPFLPIPTTNTEKLRSGNTHQRRFRAACLAMTAGCPRGNSGALGRGCPFVGGLGATILDGARSHNGVRTRECRNLLWRLACLSGERLAKNCGRCDVGLSQEDGEALLARGRRGRCGPCLKWQQ
jgi:hypothetical protein